uniref:ParB N-terminal domain-containing protein n=1 Tax=Jeotgalibaca porci TaxID=1868793 RepID=UPI0035A18913
MKNKDLVSNYVYQTTNYDQFKLSEKNRNILLTVKQFNAFKEDGVISPIFVNEDMIVIDGQHRLEYAKRTNTPIEYIVIQGLGDDTIVKLNTTQRAWSTIDYIEAYANDGSQNYIDLVKLIKRFNNLQATVIATIATDVPKGGSITRSIKDGTLKEINVPEAIEKLELIESLFEGEPRLKSRQTLVITIYNLLKIKKFDLGRLISKMNSLREKDMNAVNYDLATKYNSIGTKTLLDVYNRDLDTNSPKYIDYSINSKGVLEIVTD